MDPRLRAAVDASVRWYDDVFALHRIPVRREGGLWSALGSPPPWHSAVKTFEPGVEAERAVRATDGFAQCTVADSFGDLDLAPYGFEVLIEATWLHRGPDDSAAGTLPDGWSVVSSVEALAEWATAHDYAGVLPPTVLDDARFRILECRRDGRLVGGAVTHDGVGTVGLSNAWGAGGVGRVRRCAAGGVGATPGPSRDGLRAGCGARRDGGGRVHAARPAAGLDPLTVVRDGPRVTVSSPHGTPPPWCGRLPWRHGLRGRRERRAVARAAPPEDYAVLRKAGTERAFVGSTPTPRPRASTAARPARPSCSSPTTKFHSGCGWPSFYQPMTDTVEYIEDVSSG